MEGLPGIVVLQVQSVKLLLNGPRQQRVYVRFKYGNMAYTTPQTTQVVAGDEYTWLALGPPLPSLPSLSLQQERSRNLVDRDRQTEPRADGIPRSFLQGIRIQENQGLRDREVLRKSATPPRLQTGLIIRVQLLNNVGDYVSVKLEVPGGTGSAVLDMSLVGLS